MVFEVFLIFQSNFANEAAIEIHLADSWGKKLNRLESERQILNF